MDIEYHYWGTALIAQAAGLTEEEVEILAYCSQYVDDNDTIIEVYNDIYDVKPVFQSTVSQTLNILMPKEDLMKIYPVFHFVPGDQGHAVKRKDAKFHILNTTPDSANVRMIMDEAIARAIEMHTAGDTSGLYALGIAVHVYADTWAHQNFIGWYNSFNSMGRDLAPNIGHADALHSPDWIGYRWSDNRLDKPDVNNNIRYISASKKLYEYLVHFTSSIGRQPNKTWNILEQELLGVFGSTYSGSDCKGRKDRIDKFKSLLPNLPDYDGNRWLGNAVDSQVYHRIDIDGYDEKQCWRNASNPEKTDWVKFQEGVKTHLALSTAVLAPLFDKININLETV